MIDGTPGQRDGTGDSSTFAATEILLTLCAIVALAVVGWLFWDVF